MNTDIHPKRVLILDDQPVVLEQLDRCLRNHNFEPIQTTSWTTAIDLVTHNTPDLAILDLQMPTIQGNSVLDLIRQDGHSFPIIVMSAYLNEEKMDELRLLGANEFISKPFHLNDLVNTVQRLLGQPPVPESPQESEESESSPKEATAILPEELTDCAVQETHEDDPPKYPRKQRIHRRELLTYARIALICLFGAFIIILIKMGYTSEDFVSQVKQFFFKGAFNR